MRGPSGRGGQPARLPVGDQGFATVWAAVTAATLCTVFAVILAFGQVVAVRHRAGSAADLAALAAADRALEGTAAACASAEEVAGAQGAEVVHCAVLGEVADVMARARFGPYAPEVRSRAGPAADVPPPWRNPQPERSGSPRPAHNAGAP
ncbi:Rv3654c family TadE-like protein [Streptomyces sp. NPDC019224]|uniref:Rv3654c family TadE-like protein n=1 Tax=Streptomyces sp. NPDC019224 TaxID=3154484 RepID=UPI0033E7A969